MTVLCVGDSMVGALCASLVRGYAMEEALSLALHAARLAVTVPEAVPPSLSWTYLTSQQAKQQGGGEGTRSVEIR